MSLQDAMKEMKEQLEELNKEEPTVEETPEEVKEEEAPKEEEEPKKEEKEEEKLDNSGYARLRREAAAAQKLATEESAKRAELEARLAVLERGEPEEPREVAPEIKELLNAHKVTQAEREFQSLEESYRARNPEYDAVAREYSAALMQSIKIQNPRLSHTEIVEKTKFAILSKAGAFLNKGFDPVEELYHEAKELGFHGKKSEPVEEKEDKQLKPDMKKVAANRARNAGTAAAPGKSEGNMTKTYAVENLTNDEWRKLPIAEKKRLMQNA